MKPLNENPFVNKNQLEVREEAKAEIKAFIHDECTFAELPKFDDVTLQTSAHRYEKAAYTLGISHTGIKIHVSKGKIIAEKTKYYNLGHIK